MLQREHSGDGCDLASTLCKYDLFVWSWERVRRVRRGSISSDLLMCGGGVRNRCMYMVHVSFHICCGDSVGVCGNVYCLVAIVKDCGFLALEC